MTDQVAYWNGAPGERWVREQVALDAMLRPFGDAALETARVIEGEAVLDVGCGCGDTALALAERVGERGRVLGVDVSLLMLARARERGAGRTNLAFLDGDAADTPLDPASIDLLFSRFGVMFFRDPRAAFRRLRPALRTTGRLAFACWRPLADNPWAEVPFEAAVAVLGRPDADPPDAPGPFAFGDPNRVKSVLTDAGWSEPVVRPFDTFLSFGGGASLGDAAAEIARLGPVARLLTDRDDHDVGRTLAAITEALPRYAVADGKVVFPAAAWIVSARNTP